MSLTIYTGGSGSGKTYTLLTNIIQDSMKHPEKNYYVIVPEQSTMQTQKDLVRMHPNQGIMNIDVLSFNRLAYRVFSETGFRAEDLLEEIGKTFLLEKIALEEQKQLDYFGKTLTRQENLAEMKAILSELMLYNITPENLLESLTDHENEKNPFTLKTKDISFVYRKFLDRMEGVFMTAEEVPDKLCRVVEKSQRLKGSVMVLDGFTGFTPIQMKLIKTLLPILEEMYVTLTLDEKEEPSSVYRHGDLFSFSRESFRLLKQAADEARVHMNPVVVIGSENDRFCNSRELRHLEKNVFRKHAGSWNQVPKDIHLFGAPHPHDEVEEIAGRISRLVREEGYRYRDIAIVTGDLNVYDNDIIQSFQEWDIPYFLDEKRRILANPLIEYLRSALEICANGFDYDSMFRLLKNSLTDFDSDAVDHLENYALGTGLRGKKRWNEPFYAHYRGQDPGEVPYLEQLRKEVMELLMPLSDVFSKRGSTVKEKTAALYEFCVRSHVEEKLKQEKDRFEEIGRGDLVREYAQVYPYVINVMDKLVDVLGEEKISQKDYQSLLEAAFGEGKVAIIPPGADRVLVGDMERSRLGDIKVLFFMGVNEGIIPKNTANGGLFSDMDREKLLAGGIKLKPTAREAMYIERFYLYLTLTKPSQKLYLSYSGASASGEVLRPAYLVDVIKKIFPLLAQEDYSDSLVDRLERKRTGISLLSDGIGKLSEEKLSDDFLELFSYYRMDPDFHRRIDILLEAAEYEKPEDMIGEAAAKALYGSNLRNSASRLEEFCACEFRHFLNYGLKLKERPSFVFSGLQLGSLMHRSLEHFAEVVEEHNEIWNDLNGDSDKRSEYVLESIRKTIEEEKIDLLHDSARNEYQIDRMTRLLNTTVWALAEALHAGEFTLSDVEAAFESPEVLDAMNVLLPDGSGMTLTGRIDRIDTFEADGRTWVKIIDYKTGNTAFDLNQVYYGLQMQLLVYLNAAIEMLERKGKHALPAGIFYYQIKDPVVEYQTAQTIEDVRDSILEELKVSGVVLEDNEVIGYLDREFQNGSGKSKFIPVGYTKSGKLTAASKHLTLEQFDTLESYIKRKIKDAAVCILKGDAAINPYEYGTKTACDFCLYRTICGFDRKIPGYRYRVLEKQKDDEIIKKMEEGEDA